MQTNNENRDHLDTKLSVKTNVCKMQSKCTDESSRIEINENEVKLEKSRKNLTKISEKQRNLGHFIMPVDPPDPPVFGPLRTLIRNRDC